MPPDVLRSRPPGIEAHAFADQGHFRRVGAAPADVDQPRRAHTRAADRVDERVVGLEQRVAHGHREFRVMAFGQSLCRGRELHRSHIVGRCVDEIAAEEHAFGNARGFFAVDAVGQHQFRLGAIVLAVARKAVEAENPGQRGAPTDIVRHIAEPIGAGVELLGESRRRQRIAALAEAEDVGRRRAGCIGNGQKLAVLGREACARKPVLFAFPPLRHPCFQALLRHRMERHCAFCTSDEGGMHAGILCVMKAANLEVDLTFRNRSTRL